MENYYLFVVFCCFLPFIGGGIYFALHDKEQLQNVEPRMRPFPFFRTAEDFMIRGYYYRDLDFSYHSDGLLERLEKVNCYDPRNREPDKMDKWFKNATRKLMHDGYCLSYIDYHGHLSSTFWKNMSELGIKPEEDEKFQCLLVSVSKPSWGLRTKNFGNLLYHYASHYELLPFVTELVMTDDRFADSRRLYEFAHTRLLQKKAS